MGLRFLGFAILAVIVMIVAVGVTVEVGKQSNLIYGIVVGVLTLLFGTLALVPAFIPRNRYH